MIYEASEIIKLKAGRLLDRLIAENIFHIRVYYQAKGYPLNYYNGEDIPDYSSDIKHAMSILNKLHKEGWGIQNIYRDDFVTGIWTCEIGLTEEAPRFHTSNNLAEAICIASLLTCKVVNTEPLGD